MYVILTHLLVYLEQNKLFKYCFMQIEHVKKNVLMNINLRPRYKRTECLATVFFLHPNGVNAIY